jgi:hypothetical protein
MSYINHSDNLPSDNNKPSEYFGGAAKLLQNILPG